jgi:hypothetical protein
MSFRAWCIAAALLLLQSSAAEAASGTALGVDPAARLKSETETKTLVVGTDIFIGDTIMTDAEGQVQIRFFDGTELVVGPRSALVIQDYLIREDNSAGKMVLDALGGTFRFVTGEAPKDRYQIRTPGAVLAVRGTAFDFNVNVLVTPPQVNAMAYEGLVIMCDELIGNCIELGKTCQVGASGGEEGAQVLGFGRKAEGMGGFKFNKAFLYAGPPQMSLLPEFRIPEAGDCGRWGGPPAEVLTSEEAPDEVASGPGPVPEPEPEPEPEPPPPSGDCAGNSDPNPGNSQNCNK